MTPSTPVRRVGYVVSLFPSYDETFILREMKALTEQGVSLRIFSLRRREQDVVQEDARAFIPGTHYVPYLLSADVLAALTRASLRQTWAVARVVALIVRGCWRRPMALLKSLAFVPKAIRFAEIAREQGIERLHAHWATYPATTTLLMSRLTGIPWGLTPRTRHLQRSQPAAGEDRRGRLRADLHRRQQAVPGGPDSSRHE